MAHTPEAELGIDTGAKLGSVGETDPGIDTGAALTAVVSGDIDTGTVITAEAEIGLLPAN